MRANACFQAAAGRQRRRRHPTTATEAIRGGDASAAVLGLAVFGVALLGALFALYHLFDFHVFWSAGRDVLHGRSPYPSLASIASDRKDYYVYPPVLALVGAPLGALPFPVAGALFAAGLVAATALALRLLGVRDLGCYAVCLAWAATLQAIALGTVGPLLVLLLALAWRHRDRRLVCAGAVAAAVCLKVFLWPLLVWLLATRRYRTGTLSALLAGGSALAAWAAIGFAGLRSYPHLLERLTSVEEGRSFSLTALSRSLGFPEAVGRTVLVLAAVVILGGIVALARRDDGDRRAFALAVAASLALTPIVWLHYFCLLVVPIAVASPRMSRLWLIPAALVLPIPTSGGHPLLILWAIAVATAAFAVVLRPQLPGGSRRRVPVRALRPVGSGLDHEPVAHGQAAAGARPG